ncbi:hypothetical protein LBW62_11180 [Ralstonia solanacearum]|uniref:SRPBCC family protein n=2 Tax=Ralstonia solanacearum TaxID=305 RepID=UPI0005AC025F|nr:SRPBCC family protein [Ralstonia solanacearum]MBB6592111.1 hypothetical protein [Ralstonia solanacearum]MBB6596334.1 hypothetical protein [Ralstonia solanacearum]MDB0541825.1 hypothetical protein [Ralstonia solanacearum]MDB0552057.1 hypothetical protein [Ralstonia solanacearum]MDB0556761.1 hypothetical protein [Ralstonia solanacearum]
MARRRLTLTMPGSAADAFEAFHNHEKRLRWDTLLSSAHVEGGGTHPYVGAITANTGRGWMRGLSMRTRFVSYRPPELAAAATVGPAGPIAFWAASMHHRDIGAGESELIYTFSLRLRPSLSLFDPLAAWIFECESRRRFAAMADYLRHRQADRKPVAGHPQGGLTD